MGNPTVHGTKISTYVRSVRMALEEKGQGYGHADVDIMSGAHKLPDFLKLNPFGKVPAFTHDGLTLFETSAILQYIDETFPGTALMPADPAARARVRQIMGIVDAHAYPSMIAAIVIQRLIVPMQGGMPDQAIIDAATPTAATSVAALEGLATGGDFLVGGNLTLADIMLAPVWAYFTATPDYEGLVAHAPKLKAWWASISQRKSLQTVLA